jgi:hypothetical protein
MARLSNTEKKQFAAATRRTTRKPPVLPVHSLRAYMEFATFAARFNRTVKPVRFVGNHWKL